MVLRSLVPAVAVGVWLVVATGAPAQADLYRWTDESGHLHFTGDPSKVPARHREQAARPLDDTKSTLNRLPSDGQAPRVRAPRRSSHAPTRPGQRPARRMDAFVEKTPPAAQSPPQKYDRDCNNASRVGRCRAWVNPEWKKWKREQDAKNEAADEFGD